MNTALPVHNAAHIATTPAGTIGAAVRSALASVLTAILKHSRSIDGTQLAFVSADQVAAQTAPAGTLKMAYCRMSESMEQRNSRLQAADLAEATDLYDLEFRSRQWDRKNRVNSSF